MSDLRASEAPPRDSSRAAETARFGGAGKGPVAEALLHLADEVDHALLLFDCFEDGERTDAPLKRYVAWLEDQLRQAGKPRVVDYKPVIKGDPTSFDWVYNAMRQAIAEYERRGGVQARYYLVGPGTPTMAACTLIIARLSACIGVLWQTDIKSSHGCRRLELPFDLKLQDAPDPTGLGAERTPGEQSQAQGARSAPIVCSPSTRRAWRLAERAAHSQWPVLILGNTGTGKEVLAQHIHNCRDSSKKFVPVNCGAIPANLIEAELFGYKKGAFTGAMQNQAGVFEAAGDGTVFLDEIGELPLEAQTRFLRVLQEKKVTRLGEHSERAVRCRIVAATHRDLWQDVRAGRFRADLYYRLAALIITLDDLVDRPADLQQMIDVFWSETIANNPGFPGRELSAGARQALLSHTWPGNVRELRAALVRAAFLASGPQVSAEDIELALGQIKAPRSAEAKPKAAEQATSDRVIYADEFDFKEATKRYQRQLVENALAIAQGNKSQAARRLGLSVQHLRRILKS